MAAADDKPSRIDQVFADPHWVGEALTAAAVEAIKRHQRAGVPVVVFRDGRIEHVPAERLAPDVDALLKDVDFEAERSASETIAWFVERRSAINSCLIANEPALLHQGRFKRFYEELYPFALWLGHLYQDREDVACFLKSSTSTLGDYDAVVKDCATDPATVTYVQLTTTTFDRDESLRMKRFLKGEVVPAYGPPDELEWVTHEEMLKDAFDKIEQRVQRNRAALTSFVTARLPAWALNVATLYIVGISGRTFLTFPTPSRER